LVKKIGRWSRSRQPAGSGNHNQEDHDPPIVVAYNRDEERIIAPMFIAAVQTTTFSWML
jgi:hypothetical protein